MGFLSESSAADSDTDSSADTGSEQSGDTSSDSSTNGNGGEYAQPEPQKTERVALPSRRERAAQRTNEIKTQLESIQKSFGETQKQWETRMSQLAEENARVRGQLEAFVQQRQQPQIIQQQPQKSPDEIRREARRALDGNDFDTYERLNREAILMEVRGIIPQQQPAQPQAPQGQQFTHAHMMMMQFPDVVNAGQRGQDLAVIEDQKLAIMGIPNGPDRWRKAFELASSQLKPNQAPSFSQQSRGALSGVPGGRSGAGGGTDPGVELTAYEISVAEKCGMTKAEYAQYLAQTRPDRVRNG